ncbi:MAG: hypothetical protein AAGD11_00350 [Planctomycetota bacterium]
MNGHVDEDQRALLEVSVGAAPEAAKSTLIVWVDTAFNGGLVLPHSDIQRFGLKEFSSTSAILADGQRVELPTFTCFLDWFGKEYRTQVIANEGAYPLLGTSLLNGHDLQISYKRKTVTLE